MIKLGLIGKHLSHSYSKSHFGDKFSHLGLTDWEYNNIELEEIGAFADLDIKDYRGFNVTIPYKEAIIPYLDELHETASAIGAVNTILVDPSGGKAKLIGYNTDAYGFKQSIRPFLRPEHQRALIFGRGGASKAVAHVLKSFGIHINYIRRKAETEGEFTWEQVNDMMLKHHQLLINTTPIGMYPNEENELDIPYDYINDNHLVIDLIYNPEKTAFLKRCEERGAAVLNGRNMLYFQAEKAWEIWNQ